MELLHAPHESGITTTSARGAAAATGGFTGLLLGWVSSDCAAYARCPVLIIRGE